MQAQETKKAPPPAQQTQEKADEVRRDVDDIARTVRLQRFVRLDAHAKKMGWVLKLPPPPGPDKDKNQQVLVWWSEWCVLKMEFDPPKPPAKTKPPAKPGAPTK